MESSDFSSQRCHPEEALPTKYLRTEYPLCVVPSTTGCCPPRRMTSTATTLNYQLSILNLLKVTALFFLPFRGTMVLLLQKEVVPCVISHNLSVIFSVRQT